MRKLWFVPILLAASRLNAAMPSTPILSTGTPGTAGITLAECYQKAIKVSETLAINEQEIRQLEAQYRQGVGSVLPTISWQRTDFWQDTSGVSQSSSDVQGTLLRSHRPESSFRLEQPLFNGFKEFNAIQGFTAAREGAKMSREQASLDLLSDLAEVFYTSLDLQSELDVLANQRKLTEDRLKELHRRVQVGRSRDSEVLSSEVEMAALDALMEDTRQRWAAARQMLFFLTQVPSDVPLSDTLSSPMVVTLDDALLKSSSRPDLKAADQQRKAQRFRLKYARGGYYPSLDFTGNYYTERVGFNEDVKWDALLSLNVPIFSGLQTKAEVAFANAQLAVADLQWSRLNRQVRQQVETAHLNLRYTLSQAQFYNKAVDLAVRNYKLQLEEYRLGLINNLQVIQVLNDLQDLQLRKLRTDAATRLNDVRLRVAMGQGL